MLNVLESFRDWPADSEETVVCLGNFDGVHRGHQAVFEVCLSEAKRRELQAVAMTFNPHPRLFFQPENERFRLILSRSEKEELFDQFGMSAALFQNFDEDFSLLSKDFFLDEILVKKLKAQCVVVGRDFRFGFQAKGSPRDIERHPLIELRQVEDLVEGHQSISSSLIRESIQRADLESARRYLGYPYFVTGRVCRGDQRGQSIGFPTANLQFKKDCLLPAGVYLSIYQDQESKQFFPSVTNWGRRPSFGKTNMSFETHLIDFLDDLYDRSARVFLLEKIRDEIKFESAQSLAQQISRDLEQARQSFESLQLLQSQKGPTKFCLNQFDALAQGFQAFKFL